MPRYKNIGIVHHGLLAGAGDLAKNLARKYKAGRNWWLATQDTLHDSKDDLKSTDLIITIGGDGTILRGVHVAAARDIPVLGVNMGRVGFMSEIEAKDAVDEISWYLDGNARIERRYMLSATIRAGRQDSDPVLALNDITVARGALLRVIEVSTVVDGVHLATYRGDGVVVSTATGSTGYSLALGGPVMDPQSRDFLVKPIATHMSQVGGVILQESSKVELTVLTDHDATLSADGFVDQPLGVGETVTITQAGDYASFLRRKPPADFWGDLSRRLGLRKGSFKTTRQRRR
ncbi:MAG: NAD(+)/NADH kinase [Chloroflexi bacterium]|nr:MAG: NAD(+)/NADH kinase [Chloroflexota bacterium]